jgi:hypothetical protein
MEQAKSVGTAEIPKSVDEQVGYCLKHPMPLSSWGRRRWIPTARQLGAEPFLKAGLPCFVDKPFACKRADALAMIELAKTHKAPLMSCSSLRYTPELTAYLADAKHGTINSAFAFGPASEHARNPGLFHYGIHAVEILYSLMGPGCQSVSAIRTNEFDEVVGSWKDGRIGTVRGIRTGAASYGAIAFAKSAVTNLTLPATFIYREMLKQVIACFQTKRSPLDIAITLEMVTFIETATASVANHGIAIPLPR